VVHLFINESHLHSLFQMDAFSVVLDDVPPELIETDLLKHINVSSLSGLAFVFPAVDASNILFCHNGLKNMYVVNCFFQFAC